jgi:hypothetical protein
VREDYSADGEAWDYLTHDMARGRAYRWGEDGIAGISDNHQRLCFLLALWKGNDPILKERFFGLAGPQGNHGEDVKEYYWYLDNTPIHSYMKMLYKYPQNAFPYESLLLGNASRGYGNPEFELIDTGVFDGNRYFDIEVEYAKKAVEDIFIRITAINRGPDSAHLQLIPTLWFRNTWSWGNSDEKPFIKRVSTGGGHPNTVVLESRHATLGTRWFYCDAPHDVLFTETETNGKRLYGIENLSPYVKDSIHAYVVHDQKDSVNPAQIGTKASVRYRQTVPSGQSVAVLLRLSDIAPESVSTSFTTESKTVFNARKHEADVFYAEVNPFTQSEDARKVQTSFRRDALE